jgi:outer membrane protein TolC
MAENSLLKELRKARKGNTFEADPATVLIEVIEELIRIRKDLDAAEVKIAALEAR